MENEILSISEMEEKIRTSREFLYLDQCILEHNKKLATCDSGLDRAFFLKIINNLKKQQDEMLMIKTR